MQILWNIAELALLAALIVVAVPATVDLLFSVLKRS